VIEVLCGPLLGLEPGELALSSVELIAAMLKTFLRLTQRLSGPVGARPSAGPQTSPSAGVAESLMPRADALLGLGEVVPGDPFAWPIGVPRTWPGSQWPANFSPSSTCATRRDLTGRVWKDPPAGCRSSLLKLEAA
jgi:hypothetical protein